jgi:hypothetical protein
MLAGMWGFYNAKNRQLANQILNTILNKDVINQYSSASDGNDQLFLQNHVYSVIRENSVIHDSYLCQSFGGTPYPTQRVGPCHIGGQNAFICENFRNQSFAPCPKECRPKDHQDWITC